MKLLIVTQKVDRYDPILGFFHRWIAEFAKHASLVNVLCLEVGEHALPKNVTLHSLGKDQGRPKIIWLWRLLRCAIEKRTDYEAVFVHMNPEYVVYAGWLWRLLQKPITLWYTHKSVTWMLRIAEKFVSQIATASVESCCIESDKISVVGHGIDTDLFTPRQRGQSDCLRLISVGRFSRTKGYDLLVEAVDLLRCRLRVRLTLVGGPITDDDREYEREVRELIKTKQLEGDVSLLGPQVQEAVVERLAGSDLFVHASETGSIDKVVLEALAMGLPVVSTSEAFSNMLSGIAHDLVPRQRTPGAIAACVERIAAQGPPTIQFLERSRTLIERAHSLPRLIQRLSNMLHS
jgi:glycosyltransferase involved in cell wall biosynthesis